MARSFASSIGSTDVLVRMHACSFHRAAKMDDNVVPLCPVDCRTYAVQSLTALAITRWSLVRTPAVSNAFKHSVASTGVHWSMLSLATGLFLQTTAFESRKLLSGQSFCC